MKVEPVTDEWTYIFLRTMVSIIECSGVQEEKIPFIYSIGKF